MVPEIIQAISGRHRTKKIKSDLQNTRDTAPFVSLSQVVVTCREVGKGVALAGPVAQLVRAHP